MRMSISRTFVLFTAMLSLAGCGRGRLHQALVPLADVLVAGFGLRGGTPLVNLQVQNPNRFDLHANELEYQLEIAETQAAGDTSWIDLASGTYDEPFSVGAGEVGPVQVPVEFTYAGLGGAA